MPQPTHQKLGVPVTPGALVVTNDNPDDYTGASFIERAEKPKEEEKPSGFIRRAADYALSGLQGMIGVPQAAVGLADLVTGGNVGKALENEGGSWGFRPDEANAYLEGLKSPEQQAANRKVHEASVGEPGDSQDLLSRIGRVGVAAIENPSVVAHSVVQSLPSMAAGGLVGRGVLSAALTQGERAAVAALPAAQRAGAVAAASPRLSGVAGGIGEGVVTMGQQAEQVRTDEANPSRLLSPTQALLAGGSGAVTGAIGMVSGKLAQRLGIETPENLLAGVHADPVAKASLVRRVIGGAVTEGVLEELPQSVQEQVAQNIATGQPWDKDVDQQAVLGALAGAAMGAGAQAFHKVPDVGPLSRAANLAADGVAPATPPAPAGPTPNAPVTLTPEQEDALKAHANERARVLEEKASGTKDKTVTGPGGQKVVIPGKHKEFLSPAEQAELKFLKEHGGDVQGLARAYGPLDTTAPGAQPAPPAPPPLSGEVPAIDEDAVIARMEREQRRLEGEAAGRARAGAGEDELGVVSGKPQTQKPEPAESPAPEAPQTPAVADAPKLDDIEPAHQDDILNPQGQPFKERFAAKRSATRLPDPSNYQIVQVQGGYALRRVAGDEGKTSGTQPEQRGQAGTAQAPTPAGADRAAGQPAVPAAAAPAADEAGGVTSEILDSDILNPKGAPFKEKGAALVAQKKNPGSTLVQVVGGWVVRPQPKTLGPAPIDAQPAGTRGTNAEDVARSLSSEDSENTPPTIDEGAHGASTSPENDLLEPTDAQKKAGNYQKGHVSLNGLDLSIENPSGSVRSGMDRDGKAWSNTLQHHYGYIKGTVGNDKDHVDLFVKPGTPLDYSGPVFVVDQVHPDTGKFDEHKALVGFDTEQEARDAYAANYAKDWKGLKSITSMPFDEFKSWVKDGPKNKPLAEEASPPGGEEPATPPAAPQTPTPAGTGPESDLAQPGAQEDNEPATQPSDAAPVPTGELPDRGQVGAGPHAASRGGDRKQVDDGVAQEGQGPAASEPVLASAQGAGDAGARSAVQPRQQPSGEARDRAGVRPEPGATGAVDPATSQTSDKPALDHDIDADEIGKGGLRAKYRDNVAAIRILKAMEAEGRVATPDERRQIARYVGWGALKGVFDHENKQWAKEHAELKALLTDDEYKAARASVLNAHYTSPTVVQAMFKVLERLGFKHGRVLEPSVGVGNFFGLMPREMRAASALHGVELDVLTSKLAAALYPNARIAQATGFQNFDIPSEYFDLAIGNPPFGPEPIVDAQRSPYSGFSIHNYFFAKSIDKLRPGGLMVMVVSHNFLDAKDARARQWIAERANLVGAVRLPNTTFKENAGTEVVTDIIVFQKKGEGVADIGEDWVGTTEIELRGAKTGEATKHTVSSYFQANPSNILGTQTAAGSMYRADEYTVDPRKAGDLEDHLTGWEMSLPESIYTPIERDHQLEAADVEIPDGVKVGSFFVASDGAVRVRGNDVMGRRTARGWDAPNAKAEERLRGMIGLRDALRTQMRLERLPESTAEQIEANRAVLNKQYDAFKKAHGFLNDQTNRRLFVDDTEAALVQALEFDYDKGVSAAVAAREGIEARAPKVDKADIFARRVLFPPADNIKVTNAKDALLASLNYRGRVDMDYMRGLYERTPEQITKELGEVLFDDPMAGLVTADEYLSGDVKTKLAEAEAAAKGRPELARNVEALRNVIPADKKPSEIHASLGAAFVPGDAYAAFAKHITGGDAQVHYVGATAQWIVNVNGRTDPALMTGQWGTSRVNAAELIAQTMAGRVAVVFDTHRNPDGSTTRTLNEKDTEQAREKQNAIKAEWQSWLWKDAERADRVATIYNDKMNRIVNRRFDGSHMTFPGMSPAINLLEHQRNAVWRGLQDRQLLLDHVVGAGKTFEMATLAMEMRRLGVARKPLLAVPNHLTLQWRSEFTRLYPAANVLAATPDDFAKGNREKFFSKVITGDWDAVIIGHSSLKKIGLPAETEQKVLQEQLDEISDAIEAMKRERGDRRIVADMERIRANLNAKLQTKLQRVGKRDRVVTFDELGIDAFMVDELHEFKNLTYQSTMDRVPGMGNPGGSDKSFDLFVKLQWMFDTYGDKAPIVGATGTPVSNSLVEMYNMQRFLQYPTLKREGLHVFDAWAKQFGKVESVYEVAPSGTGYRASSRFAKFANLPALMGHYGSIADVVTLDDLKAQEEAQGKRFPVPKIAGGRPQNIVAERSPLVAAFMGVPMLKQSDGGDVLFGINIGQNVEPRVTETPQGRFNVTTTVTWEDGSTGEVDNGTFDTEADARMAVVEKSLSPEIGVDPNSILGQFANLRQLMKESNGKVNALSLTGAANKAGLDYRLILPTAPDFPGSKINLAIDKMMATYKRWTKDKGTQLVFCDLSVPLSARSGFESKERRLYVREDGAVVAKRGTMHVVEGFESLPYFIVPSTTTGAKVFDVYDAATGLRARGGMPSKAEAKTWAEATIREEAKRIHWIEGREKAGEISQDELDDYNTTHEIDTEESPGITREDIAGMSGSAKFSVYDDIRAKLIARGVPEAEIAFIHDYQTPVAKDKLFKAVNAGQVRFLLGSTPKMGAGTNVQKRLVGLHHIDAPWRPSDLEQREGRIIRRGNSLYERDPDGFDVEIYRYATAQTYDTRRWQILEHKARGIEQLRKYDGTITEIEDIDGEAANAADMKAAASGDPLILEETRLRNDVKRLVNLQSAHADEVQVLNKRARDQDAYAAEYGPKELATYRMFQGDAAKVPMPGDGSLPFSINGQRIADKDKAVEAITRKVAETMIGQVPGFKMVFRGVTFEMARDGQQVRLDSPLGLMDSWKLGQTVSPSGLFQRFENWIERLGSHITDTEAKIKRAAENAVSMREQAKKPWAQAADLEKARAAHKRVQRRLLAKGPAVPDQQKPMLESGMERQKAELRERGFGDALDEFLSARKADEAVFSRSRDAAEGQVAGSTSRGQPAQQVQVLVAAITSRWANAPRVEVVQSLADPRVPQEVRNQARDLLTSGTAGEPEGFFDPKTKTVYLIAYKLGGDADTLRVLMHEALGHFGLRGVFGSEFGTILDRLATLNPGKVREAARQLGYDFDKRPERRLAAEEVLAYMAQSAPELGWVRRAVAAIRTWLREHVPGFSRMGLSDAEIIRDYLLPAQRYVRGGGPRGGASLPAAGSDKAVFSRGDESPAANALRALSQDDEMFALPRADGTTVAEIAAQIDPEFKVRKLAADPGQQEKYAIELPDGTVARLYVRAQNPYGPTLYGFDLNEGEMSNAYEGRPGENPDAIADDVQDVYIDVSKLKPGLGGGKVYAIAAAYAHNTGRIFIGDPSGLSDEAMRRRPEQMLSSALRYGTTEHLAPHPRQEAGAPSLGVPPLRWVYGDHIGNIERLVDLNLKALENAGLDDSSISFDPASGVFKDSTGAAVSRADINTLGAAGFGRRAHASGRTIARGAVLRALLREEGGQGAGGRRRDGLLAGLARLGSDAPQAVARLFSRSGMTEALASGVNNVRDWQLPAGYKVGDLFDSAGKLNWWHKTVGTMHNLAKRSPEFSRVYEGVQTFINDVSYYASEAADLAPRILPKLDSIKDVAKMPLSPEDTKALSRPVFEGTLSWGRDSRGVARPIEDIERELGAVSLDDKAHLMLRNRLIDPKVLRMWQGLPMEQYEAIIDGKFEREFMQPGVVFTPAELKKHFGMSDAQVALYQEFRKATDRSINDLAVSDMLRFGGQDVASMRDDVLAVGNAERASTMLRDKLLAMADADPKRAEVLRDTANKMVEKGEKAKSLIGRGYAPLSRFGQYTLDVVDSDGKRVYFGLFEGTAERAKMARKMAAQFPGAKITTGTVSQEAYKLFSGVSPETLELFGEMLGMETDGSDETSKAFQTYLKLAKSTRSSMKRLIQRQGIAGFSEDAGRVLAGFVYSNARQTASNLHMGHVTHAVSDIPQGQGQLKDAAVRLLDYVKNPQEEAQAIRGMLFAQYLGGSVASAMVNATQPVAVTLPYLSQYGGVAKATRQMLAAFKDATKATTGDAKLDAALKHAEEEGIVSPQEVHALQAQAMGRSQLRSGDGTIAGNSMARASNAFNKVALVWGKVFGVAEQYNRRVTFIAAYRTAVAMGRENPAKFAADAVADTQFTYGKGNKPQWARGAVGSLAFTFKQYSISYVELLHRMATAGEPGSPERAAGRRAAVMALGILFLMAGADGLPFAEDIEDVVDGAMQRMGYNFSSKQRMKKFLAEHLGQGGAEFVTSGMSGLPGAPIDVSGRLSLGNMIPGTGLLQRKADHTRDVIEFAGAAGDLASRALKAADFATQGEMNRARQQLQPVALRNVEKAYDMAVMGEYRDDRGYKVVDTDAVDSAFKAIGFQPHAVKNVQDATREVQRTKDQYNLAAADIRARLAQGIYEKDQAKIDAARDELRSWNEKNPDLRIQLNMGSVLARVREMRMDKVQRVEKTTPKAIRGAARQQLAEEMKT